MLVVKGGLNAIEQYELEEVELMEEEEKQRFEITDKEQLNWSFRKINALKKEINEIENLAKKETERINDWKNKESKSHLDNIEYFEMLIKQYALKQRDNNDKFKKESTPYGSVAFRKQQPAYEYKDEQATLEWLKQNKKTDLINVKESVKKTEIKKTFKRHNDVLIDNETGEVVPGVSVVEREDSIKINVEVE